MPSLPPIAFAIVGEPTQTNLAIAEKGLLVLDCVAAGKAGHAAREEGENAIYNAMQDIEWFKTYRFPKISVSLGPVKMSVTSINTENKAHNMVPAVCSFIVDIRVTDEYTHEEVLETIKQQVRSDVQPRSMRLRSSKIEKDHPLVQAGMRLGKQTYGSPYHFGCGIDQCTGFKMRRATAQEVIPPTNSFILMRSKKGSQPILN